ncbi:hypothetical protein ACNKHL_18660 [Shigella flexneri]
MPRCICFLKTMLKDSEWRICFLRRLENLLQSINDERPNAPSDELNRARLAWAIDLLTGRN